MSAAVIQPVPLFCEGRRFWEDLIRECRRLTDAVNKVVVSDGLTSDQLIRCDADEDLHILKLGYPSTNIDVRMNFHSWGPVICAAIRGEEKSGRKFKSAEMEIPIARDLDGSVVAVFDEGRSFSVQDLTRFLLQSFRRCFPRLSLPC